MAKQGLESTSTASISRAVPTTGNPSPVCTSWVGTAGSAATTCRAAYANASVGTASDRLGPTSKAEQQSGLHRSTWRIRRFRYRLCSHATLCIERAGAGTRRTKWRFGPSESSGAGPGLCQRCTGVRSDCRGRKRCITGHAGCIWGRDRCPLPDFNWCRQHALQRYR